MFRPLPPWLVFNGPDASGGNVDRAALSAEDFKTRFGFPKDTAVDDMPDAEKAAYWRDKSKGFQKSAEDKDKELRKWTGLGEFDAVSTAVTSAEQIRQQSLTDAQRAQEAADQAAQAARAAGEQAGASKYLGVAVKSALIALTIRPGEKREDAAKRVDDALEFVDVARFTDADGALDDSRVATFAGSLGSGTPDSYGGVLHTLYSRQVAPPAGSPGSVQEARERVRERLSKKK